MKSFYFIKEKMKKKIDQKFSTCFRTNSQFDFAVFSVFSVFSGTANLNGLHEKIEKFTGGFRVFRVFRVFRLFRVFSTDRTGLCSDTYSFMFQNSSKYFD